MDNDGSNINIPGFSIVEGPLGGGMALVYIAQQDHTRRRVAIKLIQPRLHSTDNMAQYAARFRREAVFQANLQSPHIATLYEFGVLDDRPFIVMEYLPGGDLDQRIREAASHPYTLEDALRILRQVALALQTAHEKGIIHRDVKPANILFRANGDAVLTDFGIAKATHDATLINEGITHTISEFALGTPRYMSPEQLRATQDSTIGSASDLYSLGATFFHMLTGRPPFQASSYMGLAEMHFTAPVPRLPKTLSALDEIIQKTMAKLPEDRYPSAAALIARLDVLERQWRSRKPAFLQQSLTGSRAVDREDATRLDTAKLVHSLRDDRTRKRAAWAGLAAIALVAAGIGFVVAPLTTPTASEPAGTGQASVSRPVERAPRVPDPVVTPPTVVTEVPAPQGVAVTDQPPPLSSLHLPAGVRPPAVVNRLPPTAAGIARKVSQDTLPKPKAGNTVNPAAPLTGTAPASVVTGHAPTPTAPLSTAPVSPVPVSPVPTSDTPLPAGTVAEALLLPVSDSRTTAPKAMKVDIVPDPESREVVPAGKAPVEKKRSSAQPLAAPIVF
jgi:serine/threonine-protein kinase PpkA